jgi:predicted phage terminase large subunit-like protein
VAGPGDETGDLNRLRAFYEKYQPRTVAIEDVAAQEYFAQDAERFMPVRRVPRTKDKVARAYWLQPFFENGQIYFRETPTKDSDHKAWQALREELLLFQPTGAAGHDDLFDALETAVAVSMDSGNVGVMVL